MTGAATGCVCLPVGSKSPFLKPPEKGQSAQNKEGDDNPVIYSQNLRKGYLTEIPPGQNRCDQDRVRLCKKGGSREHAENPNKKADQGNQSADGQLKRTAQPVPARSAVG